MNTKVTAGWHMICAFDNKPPLTPSANGLIPTQHFGILLSLGKPKLADVNTVSACSTLQATVSQPLTLPLPFLSHNTPDHPAVHRAAVDLSAVSGISKPLRIDSTQTVAMSTFALYVLLIQR